MYMINECMIALFLVFNIYFRLKLTELNNISLKDAISHTVIHADIHYVITHT